MRVLCSLSTFVTHCAQKNIRHLVTIRMGMNKMAEGDEYLDYHDKTLEQMANSWGVS